MRIGTGWCGWTEEETLATRIPTIELAAQGKLEILRLTNLATWGGSSTPAPQPAPEPMSGKEIFARLRTFGGKKK